MNLRYLEYLRLVVEKGGYAQAAEAAGVSQPAVSQAMRALEEKFGFALFERRGRQQIPTAKARVIAQASKTVNVAVKNVERSARTRSTVEPGPVLLRVGMAPAAGLVYGPVIFAALKASAPECTLRIVSGTAPSMLEDLVLNNLDLVIAPKPRRFEHLGLSRHVMYTSHPVIYARKDQSMIRPAFRRNVIGRESMSQEMLAQWASEVMHEDQNAQDSGLLRQLRTGNQLLLRNHSLVALPENWRSK